jgi:hypothetical protein
MGVWGKRPFAMILMVVTATCLVATFLGMQGCGNDQSKQEFVNDLLSIIEENQAKKGAGQEGSAAFQAYYQSGFTDLESAAAAAESFAMSNEKDVLSLQSLEDLNKPDEAAEDIVDILSSGIKTIDDGNTIYVEEFEKAPAQSVEDRPLIFVITSEVLGIYLEGITIIITSFERLLDYAKTNGLEGVEEIETWHDKFVGEKESIEQSTQAMSGE